MSAVNRKNYSSLKVPSLILIWISAIVGVFALWTHCRQIDHDLSIRFRYECPHRLFAIWMFIDEHSKRSNRFPSDLSLLTKKLGTQRFQGRQHLHPLLCPGSNSQLGSIQNASEWIDYTYINWSLSSPESVKPWYPVAYDRSISNHLGRGVYVLKLDGTVIWDRGAEWLKNFARDHTNLSIVLPE